ncbi:MAG: hypothetical protein GY746_09660 [Gammaproteobacteria bacterium]|nr:hypothetical protein [Gammaproteobacteria bacterium]
MADEETIFVYLLNESVDVWRPVQARKLSDQLYRIVSENTASEDEEWQFPSGATVRCEEREFSGDTTGLVAVEAL